MAMNDNFSSLRVAAVAYLNARPLYLPLAESPHHGGARPIEMQLGIPSEVARAIAEDDADVALMPVAAAATLGDLRLVRGIAIAANGPVRSVVVVSDCPFDAIEDLALDLSSRTSAVLARLIFRARRKGGEPRLVGCSSSDAIGAVGARRGALVIGDPALMIEGKFRHSLDLSEAWRDITGLPFVFAGWFGRAGVLSPDDEARFRAAKAEGLARRDEIADAYAHQANLSAESVRSYLRDSLRYDLGDDERRGLERFYEEAASARLLPKATVRFFDDDRAPRSSTPEPELDTLLSRAADGERLSAAEGGRLLNEASFFDLGLAADAIRRRKHPHNVVTYIVDRNVNYTNVCTTSCRFCAFYRPVGHPEGYVLTRDQLRSKLQEVVDAGGVQILLQGGLNPDLPLTWYEELFQWIKTEFGLGLHALSPEEILHLAQIESLSVRTILERLHAAGLDSVPGGGAEILVDRVRRKIARAKCTSDEWLGVMRTAHHMGLRSSCTMMYGTVDSGADRINHLIKLRDLQDETGGFTAFFCWDYQHEQGTHLPPGENGTFLYLKQQAVARILLDNIDHVGASWVTQGPQIGQVALRFGADDFGSVMFEENVVSSAGTTFAMNANVMEKRISEAGFRSVRRNVKYAWLSEPI